jgi:MFS transporter, PAT family, solute carrier family 33 (acetyl-CoA transportor), member 1
MSESKSKAKTSVQGSRQSSVDSNPQLTVGSVLAPKKRLVYSRPLVISMFFLLYIYQGMLFGLSAAISLLLKDKGLADADLSWQALASSPFYLKFLAAPFMDVFYFKQVGKRMSWILPISAISAVIYLLYAESVPHWLANARSADGLTNSDYVFSLAAFTFTQFVLVAVQDVAIDGMVCEILNEEDFEKGTLMQTLGQTIGPFLCCNILILLLSPEFSKKHFGMDSPLISLSKFFWFLSVFIIASSIFAFFTMKESKATQAAVEISTQAEETHDLSSSRVTKSQISESKVPEKPASPEEEQAELTFWDLMKLIPRMFTHKNIRNLMLMPVFFEIFLIFTDSVCFLKLIEKGFNLLFLNEFEIYFGILDLTVIFLIGRMNVLTNLWKYINISIDILLLNGVLFWVFYFLIPKEGNETLWFAFLLVYKIIRYLSNLKFTASCVYVQSVADRAFGGSFLTIVWSCHNFIRINVPAGLLRLTKYAGLKTVLGVILSWEIIFRVTGTRTKLVSYFESTRAAQGFLLSNDPAGNSKKNK